jgi:transposase InsO family protein
MTLPEERQAIMSAIQEAVSAKARLRRVCQELGLSIRTYQRWKKDPKSKDKRPEAIRVAGNAMTEKEREEILTVCTSPEYRDLSPNVIVPLLAEKGAYIGSESTFYRILRKNNMLEHRQQSRPAQPRKKPEELIAQGPKQVWSWDITYMRSKIRGLFFYLYLHMDIWSKKIVGWSVEEKEDGQIAADVFAETCLRNDAEGVYLHSDNGAPMKSASMLSTLEWLGVIPSFSRPGVSDDNPFSESLFKTMKYRPGYPGSFDTIEEARAWISRFVEWYNREHRHSSIKYVTPEMKHSGQENEILNIRKEVYKKAKEKHPKRWSGKIRNWDAVQLVTLNPKSHQDGLKASA